MLRGGRVRKISWAWMTWAPLCFALIVGSLNQWPESMEFSTLILDPSCGWSSVIGGLSQWLLRAMLGIHVHNLQSPLKFLSYHHSSQTHGGSSWCWRPRLLSSSVLLSLVLLCVFRRGSITESTFLPVGRGLGTLLSFKGSVAGYPCHF